MIFISFLNWIRDPQGHKDLRLYKRRGLNYSDAAKTVLVDTHNKLRSKIALGRIIK